MKFLNGALKVGGTTCRLTKVEKSDLFLCGSKNVWGEITSCHYKSLHVKDAGKQESEDCRKQMRDRAEETVWRERECLEDKSNPLVISFKYRFQTFKKYLKAWFIILWTQDPISKWGSVLYFSGGSSNTIHLDLLDKLFAGARTSASLPTHMGREEVQIICYFTWVDF